MMKTVNRIIFPLLFISCLVTYFDLELISCSFEKGDHEMFFSNHSVEAFHHNHFKEIEIFHEHFFDKTGLTDLSEIQFSQIKTHKEIKTVLLIFTSDYWHPPKLT